MAAVIEINFDCELCDFVSRHRYNFKRHLKRMHGKTELEAEELANDEDKKKTNEHAAADEQEEVEVEHPDNAAVGDQEDHEPVEYEEPAAQQEVRQNMDLKQILTSVGLEEYYEQFETELITIETLKTTTALKLREILKNPLWIGEFVQQHQTLKHFHVKSVMTN